MIIIIIIMIIIIIIIIIIIVIIIIIIIVIIIIIIVIIIIINFIKGSRLIAQAQCLTNWGDCWLTSYVPLLAPHMYIPCSLSHDKKECDTHVLTSFIQPWIRRKQFEN